MHSRTFDMSLTDILETALENYLVHQEDMLSRISSTEMLSDADLLEIITRLQQAYHRNLDCETTPEWVSNLIMCFSKILSIMKQAKAKELLFYFERSFPGRGKLEQRITAAINTLATGKKMKGGYAEQITKCLLFLLRDGIDEISDEMFAEIKSLLEPWSFWVAKKSIISISPSFNLIDPSLLELPDHNKYPSRYLKTKGNITLDVFLPPTENQIDKSRPCAASYHIGNQALSVFEGQSLYNLVEGLMLIKEGSETATVNEVAVFSPDSKSLQSSSQVPYLKNNCTTLFLTPDDFEDMVSITEEFWATEHVRVYFAKDYVRRFGYL